MECNKNKWDRIMGYIPKSTKITVPKLLKIYELNGWTDKEEYKQLKQVFPFDLEKPHTDNRQVIDDDVIQD